MAYGQTVLTSLFSMVCLLCITRLNGYRQMAELSMFDYINGISIGSIAAELAVAEGQEFWRWLIALGVFGLMTFLLSWMTDRSIRLRRAVSGTPVLLYRDGKLLDANFRRAKLDLSEFLMQCRNEGYFDLAQVDTILFEPNGRLSILPAAANRPATPSDLSLKVPRDQIPACVIIDGKLMAENLKSCGYGESWLMKQLKAQQQDDLSRIFLATCTHQGQLAIYPRGGGAKSTALE